MAVDDTTFTVEEAIISLVFDLVEVLSSFEWEDRFMMQSYSKGKSVKTKQYAGNGRTLLLCVYA